LFVGPAAIGFVVGGTSSTALAGVETHRPVIHDVVQPNCQNDDLTFKVLVGTIGNAKTVQVIWAPPGYFGNAALQKVGTDRSYSVPPDFEGLREANGKLSIWVKTMRGRTLASSSLVVKPTKSCDL
jgi:hypothetical protein